MFLSSPVAQNSVAGGIGQLHASTNLVAEMCIIGDGAEALALANLVSAHKVVVYSDGVINSYPNLEQLQVREFEVRERGAAVCSQRGNTRMDLRSIDRVEDLRSTEGIVIASPVTKYGAIVERLKPALRDGVTICLINSPLGAGLEFRALLNKAKVKHQVNIIEAGRLFDSARVESGVLLISGFRSKVSVCGLERNETRRGLPVASSVVDGLVPFSSVLERGLSDAERIIRPAILLSMLIADDMRLPLNQSVFKILHALDREIQGVAKAFQCVVPGFAKSLQDFTSSQNGTGRLKASTLESSISELGTGLFGLTECSREVYTKLLIDDISESLTLIADMGTLSRSPVVVISSIIDMASVLVDEDLNKKGRKLSSLGLIGFDTEEIVEIVNA